VIQSTLYKIEILEKLPKLLSDIYFIIVFLSSLYGGCMGLCHWVTWRLHRKKIIIQYKIVEPIINASWDISRLVWEIGLLMFSSGLGTAIYPMSSPVFSIYVKDGNKLCSNGQ
jgi:hypothetical protein